MKQQREAKRDKSKINEWGKANSKNVQFIQLKLFLWIIRLSRLSSVQLLSIQSHTSLFQKITPKDFRIISKNVQAYNNDLKQCWKNVHDIRRKIILLCWNFYYFLGECSKFFTMLEAFIEKISHSGVILCENVSFSQMSYLK